MSQISSKHKKITFHSSNTTVQETDRHKKNSYYGSSSCSKTENESKQSNEISYLQPEILPLEVMKKLLKMRGATEVFLNKDCDARPYIIKLFYKHITPKPQRDYKLNRLGKILLKMRCRREKGREKNDWERMVSEETSKISSGHCISSTSNISPSSCDRLKPIPCTFINLERKKIKLVSSSSLSPIKSNIVKNDHEVKSIEKISLDLLGSEKILKLSSSDPVIHQQSKIPSVAIEEKLETSRKIKISTCSSVKEESVVEKKINISPMSSISLKRKSDSSVPETKKRKPVAWP